MAPSEADRAGVVVVRVWVERGVDGLRARIIEVADLERTEEISRAAAGVEEILRIVRAFLVRFAGERGERDEEQVTER
jgi:hypothetical protein